MKKKIKEYVESELLARDYRDLRYYEREKFILDERLSALDRKAHEMNERIKQLECKHAGPHTTTCDDCGKEKGEDK